MILAGPLHSKNTCKFSVLLEAGPELPQAPPAQSTLNPGVSRYIQEKRKHAFTTHSDHCAAPLNEVQFSWDIQAAQHHSWARRIKAEHEPRGNSLIPSRGNFIGYPTVGSLNSCGPVSCPTLFPLSVFTLRSVLLLVCLVHQRLGHVGASGSTLEFDASVRAQSWHSVSRDHRGTDRKCDCKTDFTRSLGTTETVINGQKRLRDTNTWKVQPNAQGQGISQQHVAWCQLRMSTGGWLDSQSLGFYYQISPTVTSTSLPFHTGIPNPGNCDSAVTGYGGRQHNSDQDEPHSFTL